MGEVDATFVRILSVLRAENSRICCWDREGGSTPCTDWRGKAVVRGAVNKHAQGGETSSGTRTWEPIADCITHVVWR